MPLIIINDSEIMGRLVKSWATGLNYMTPAAETATPGATDTLPPQYRCKANMTRAEFDALIQAVAAYIAPFGPKYQNFTVQLPAGVTQVTFYQGDATNVVFRLPPVGPLQETERDLLAGAQYSLRGFYAGQFTCPGGGNPAQRVLTTDPDKLALHANRIGDYTISYCM